MTRLCGDYFISHEIRIPMKQPWIQWKGSEVFFFVAHLDLQCRINSHILGFATCRMLAKVPPNGGEKWWWFTMVQAVKNHQNNPCIYIYIHWKRWTSFLPKAVPRKLPPGVLAAWFFILYSQMDCALWTNPFPTIWNFMVFGGCLFVSWNQTGFAIITWNNPKK